MMNSTTKATGVPVPPYNTRDAGVVTACIEFTPPVQTASSPPPTPWEERLRQIIREELARTGGVIAAAQSPATP
jgi:hypothetical protein